MNAKACLYKGEEEMKKKKWIAALLAASMLFSLLLTACQDGRTGSSAAGQSPSQNIENDKGETQEEPSDSAPDATAHWTINEAIENHMRFACMGSFSLYAEGTKLYASYNSEKAEGLLRQYANLVASDGASPTIRQMKIDHDQHESLILDSNGKLWYQNKNVFPGRTIMYFACPSSSGGHDPSVLAGVTDEGKVIWSYSYSSEKPTEVEGLSGVKYINVDDDVIAYVREDGTAGYCYAGEDCHEMAGWSDIAMVFLCSDHVILGLKTDGTLVAETCEGGEAHYSSEILSWSDIVYVCWGFNFVAGLKSDGSVVYALDDDVTTPASEHRSVELDTWNNLMALSVFGNMGGITADRALFGDAQDLIYAWDLTQPWVNSDAALREHKEERHHSYTEKLAEID